MKKLHLICIFALSSGIDGCAENNAEKHPGTVAYPETTTATAAHKEVRPAPRPVAAPAAALAPPPEAAVVAPAALNKNRPHRAIPITIPVKNNTPATQAVYQYATKVQAPKVITKNLDPSLESSGQLLVWVGQPGYEPPTQIEMNAQSGILPPTGTEAVSARIIPTINNPLAFDIDPLQSECQRVESEGTEVSFKLIPKLLGSFRIGASVLLYAKASCSGDIITKTADPVTVEVKVGLAPDSAYQELWTAFMKFFKEILATFTALLVVFFRKKLKEIFVKAS